MKRLKIFLVLQFLLLAVVTITVSAQHSLKIRSLLGSVLPATTFSYTLDCASPLGTDAPSTLDNKIRETRYGFQERLNVDHIFGLTGTQISDEDTGYHRDIHFYSTTATDPILGVTAVSGVDELRYTNSEGGSFYLTSGGTLNIGSSDLLGTLANNTYFTAVDSAGTGTVELIKANGSDVAVIPDGSELASSAAPTADADIANKKYVDDNTTMVPAVSGAGAGYAGEESVTFPNGVILKMGATTYASNPQTITFGTAFPTAIVSVVVTPHDNTNSEEYVTAYSTTSFTAQAASSAPTTWLWMAMGY